MKNRKWIVVAMTAVLMAGTILSGCNSKKAENSEPETASVIETSEEVSEVVSEVPEEVYPDPTEPVAEFGGDPEKVVLFEEYAYYEADRFFIYFSEGCKVPDSTIDNLSRVMSDIEELFGLSYDTGREMDEDNWREFYYEGAFEYVNPTNQKPNILILPNPGDDTVEWAYQNCVMLYDTSLDPHGETYDTTYHELTHLLFAKQCGSLGQVIDEGAASYAQYELSKKDNYPAWSTIMFLEYGYYHSTYDDSAIYADPEAEFIASTVASRDSLQRHYQYGIRFVTFLMKEYGPDIMVKICENANANTLKNGNEQTYLLVDIIKKSTSDTVFTEFAEWLPQGWQDFGKEYTEYMRQFGLQ